MLRDVDSDWEVDNISDFGDEYTNSQLNRVVGNFNIYSTVNEEDVVGTRENIIKNIVSVGSGAPIDSNVVISQLDEIAYMGERSEIDYNFGIEANAEDLEVDNRSTISGRKQLIKNDATRGEIDEFEFFENYEKYTAGEAVNIASYEELFEKIAEEVDANLLEEDLSLELEEISDVEDVYDEVKTA